MGNYYLKLVKMVVVCVIGGLSFSIVLGMEKTYNCPLCTFTTTVENDFDKHIAHHCPFCEFSSEVRDALVIHIYYHKHPSRAPSAFSESHFDEQPVRKKQACLLSPTDELLGISRNDCPVSPILSNPQEVPDIEPLHLMDRSMLKMDESYCQSTLILDDQDPETEEHECLVCKQQVSGYSHMLEHMTGHLGEKK